MEPDDSRLIQACLEKDKKAWDLFVKRFSKLIYWSIRKVFMAYAFANREELVQEAFQEVFARLIGKDELKKLQNTGSVRKFLSVMACHTALDKAKALSRFERRAVTTEVLENHPAESAPSAAADETARIIEGILNELSSKERACVELHYFNELTFREIEQLLGLSEDAASTIVRRAKEKIKAKFNARK